MYSDARRGRLIALYDLGTGLAGGSLLLYVTQRDALFANCWPVAVFTMLSFVIKRFGFRTTGDLTNSLVGVVDVAAVLAFGPTLAAWVAGMSGLAYLELSAPRRSGFSWRFMGQHHVIFSSGQKALMALACGALYLRLGGTVAPVTMTREMLAPLLIAIGLWFALDRACRAGRTFLCGGRAELARFVSQTFTSSVWVELFPLTLSMVVALVYVGMGAFAFALLGLALAASAALLQHLSQVRTRLEKRVAELGVLNKFGRALVEAELDADRLCELLYEFSRQVVDPPVFVLQLVHSAQSQVDVVIHVESGQRQLRRTLPMTGTMEWMAVKRQPFISGDVHGDGLPFEPYVIGDLPKSLLIVPLLAGPELIGALSVQSYEAHAWGQDELNVLSAMAHQAAMAIANARVYKAEQRRAKQLAAVHEVSRRVAAILELDKLFADVVRLIRETFHYDHAAVFTVDPESGQVAFRASTHPDMQEQGLDVSRGEGIIGWVAERGEPVVANDVMKEPRYLWAEILADTRAELAVPLKVEDRIVGVLDVQSNEPNAFGQEDLFLLETLADQVAVAVEDARLYAARQEEAWFSTALLQVAAAVSSLDNLDEILETVVRLTPMLAGVDRCSIILWDEGVQEFVPAQGYALNPEMRPLFESIRFEPGDMPLLDQLRADRQPIVEEGLVDAIAPHLVEDFGIGSLLALPLSAQAEFHGAMLVDYADSEARFPERKRTILSGIADQAAMAIANARLDTAQREEAWVSTALLQVAQALVSSTDLSANIAKISRLVPLLVGVDRCMVYLWEKEQGEFVPYAAHGLSTSMAGIFQSLHLSPDDVPLLAEMVQQQSHVVVENAIESDLIPAILLRSLDVQSLVAAPLISKGEVLGALIVDRTQGPHRFSDRSIHIVDGVAHQMAIGVENARLYEATLEQERTAQELRMAREIQVSFLPERCPSLPGWEICADWRAAREVGGDFYDFIPLGDEHLGLVIADVSDKGMPAALFMSLSRMLVRVSATEIRSPAGALQRVNELLMSESRTDMFVTVFYGVLNWRTGRLTYANAGHNPPILWHGPAKSGAGHGPAMSGAGHGPATSEAGHGPASSEAGQTAQRELTLLAAKGIILGVIEEIRLQEREVTIEPEDILVLYTDGVTEAINAQEEEFGEQRLIETIANNHGNSCAQLVQAIYAAVSDFGRAQFDDYTLVALKRNR